MGFDILKQGGLLPQIITTEDIVVFLDLTHGGGETVGGVQWGMTRHASAKTGGQRRQRVPSLRTCITRLAQYRVSLHSQPMPPRKRAKASAASTPLRDTQPKTPQESSVVQSQDDILNDPWADEQESQLFKSMMKWKPTGLFDSTSQMARG